MTTGIFTLYLIAAEKLCHDIMVEWTNKEICKFSRIIYKDGGGRKKSFTF